MTDAGLVVANLTTVSQLETEAKNNTIELPRDEDDYLLCCFQSCTAPTRDGDLGNYFAHLREHEASSDKLLANMIAPSKPGAPRMTVLRRRNEIALGLASRSPADPPPLKQRRKVQVHIEQHGSEVVAALDGIEDGEKINMRCPIEGCPKIITGFLYHLNSHLNAHRRQLAPDEKLRVRTSPLVTTSINGNTNAPNTTTVATTTTTTTTTTTSTTPTTTVLPAPSRLTRGGAALAAAVSSAADDDDARDDAAAVAAVAAGDGGISNGGKTVGDSGVVASVPAVSVSSSLTMSAPSTTISTTTVPPITTSSTITTITATQPVIVAANTTGKRALKRKSAGATAATTAADDAAAKEIDSSISTIGNASQVSMASSAPDVAAGSVEQDGGSGMAVDVVPLTMTATAPVDDEAESLAKPVRRGAGAAKKPARRSDAAVAAQINNVVGSRRRTSASTPALPTTTTTMTTMTTTPTATTSAPTSANAAPPTTASVAIATPTALPPTTMTTTTSGAPEEFIYEGDARWRPISERNEYLRELGAKYGARVYRQDTNGDFVCFYKDCNVRILNNTKTVSQNYARHIIKHQEAGDDLEPVKR